MLEVRARLSLLFIQLFVERASFDSSYQLHSLVYNNLASNMQSSLLVLVALTLSKSVRAFNQSLSNFQPGCFPVPNLPANFSTSSDYWPHGTPLVKPFDKPVNSRRNVKRVTGYWTGWNNVHYLFALYVSKP